MNFSQNLIEKLGTMFQKYNLAIITQTENVVVLQSNKVKINIVHNVLERSNTLWLGSSGSVHLIEIDNDVLLSVFNSTLKLSQISTEMFMENLICFFRVDVQDLIHSDDLMGRLEAFDLNKSRLYNQKIILEQNLRSANTASANTDYKKFIKTMDLIGVDNLPNSYQLKYKIALKKN